MSKIEIERIKDAIGIIESNNNYSAVNEIGCWGKYQFCKSTRDALLKELHYPVFGNIESFTPAVQENVMDLQITNLSKTLESKFDFPIRLDDDDISLAEGIALSHFAGAGGFEHWIRTGIGRSDAYGTTMEDYLAKFRRNYIAPMIVSKGHLGIFSVASLLILILFF